jgi:hypothetical protein
LFSISFEIPPWLSFSPKTSPTEIEIEIEIKTETETGRKPVPFRTARNGTATETEINPVPDKVRH